ncbi:hypothetical protein C8J57DRAFT_1249726 [Mycena rebaudengoi]|nr:hypothetical protein C8J57DRAFT_1249726 [Mycena rebaudengoi]
MKACRRTGKDEKKRGIAMGRQSTILGVRETEMENRLRREYLTRAGKHRSWKANEVDHMGPLSQCRGRVGDAGRKAREGAGGPEEARGRECVGTWGSGADSARRGTSGCGDVSRAGVKSGVGAGGPVGAVDVSANSVAAGGTGGFLGICRENPAEMVPGGAGFVAGLGGLVAGLERFRAGFTASFGLWQGAGGAPGGGGGGFWGGGLPGCRVWTRAWWGMGVAEMPETLRVEQNVLCQKALKY